MVGPVLILVGVSLFLVCRQLYLLPPLFNYFFPPIVSTCSSDHGGWYDAHLDKVPIAHIIVVKAELLVKLPQPVCLYSLGHSLSDGCVHGCQVFVGVFLVVVGGAGHLRQVLKIGIGCHKLLNEHVSFIPLLLS